ncbi:MAG: anion permease [Halobacteria archaeon]
MFNILLLAFGFITAVFVGFNIGGSSTGVAFGPSVGSNVISKVTAGILMSIFVLLGGWFVGRNVVETMGGQIVPQNFFTLFASVAILFFVGLALLISNLFGVPASTSMTAVGAISGLGVATGSIKWPVIGRIVSWWIISPVIAFWLCTVVGRYIYPHLETRTQLSKNTGELFTTRDSVIPLPKFHEDVNRTQIAGSMTVVAIGCYMAFSAGASNVANAIAPLYGNGAISMNLGILMAAGAISLGAFTIARRTLDTVGNDLTDLPILAALIIEAISASIITFLSWNGIPASLAVTATCCIIGLGWGRATRTSTIAEMTMSGVEGRDPELNSLNRIARHEEGGKVKPIGEEEKLDKIDSIELFDPRSTARVVGLWVLTPTLSGVSSFLLFSVVSPTPL